VWAPPFVQPACPRLIDRQRPAAVPELNRRCSSAFVQLAASRGAVLNTNCHRAEGVERLLSMPLAKTGNERSPASVHTEGLGSSTARVADSEL
jgi:hypothetical protein